MNQYEYAFFGNGEWKMEKSDGLIRVNTCIKCKREVALPGKVDKQYICVDCLSKDPSSNVTLYQDYFKCPKCGINNYIHDPKLEMYEDNLLGEVDKYIFYERQCQCGYTEGITYKAISVEISIMPDKLTPDNIPL